MFITRVWFLMPIVAAACGGGRALVVGSRDGGEGSSGSGSASSGGGPNSSTGGPAWTDAGPPAAIMCSTVGERRNATPDENAQYCTCTQVTDREGTQSNTWLLWSCYGPPPGSPSPSTSCTYRDFSPGIGNGSCWVDWASCSDGQTYSMQCANRNCSCLVQGHRTTVLVEPRDTCPDNKPDLNALCGWNLQ
jgi:hypothetical protein